MLSQSVIAQEIQMYNGAVPGSEAWNWKEGRNNKNSMNVMTVFNVTRPTLTVVIPPSGKQNGTAIIVCPGGGFHFLAIDHEGMNAAYELADHGITVFVLKYRTIRIEGTNPFDEMINAPDPKAWDEEALPVIPLAIDDARNAIEFVREHAAEYNLKMDRIGIMGFSAGGLVTASTAFDYGDRNRPDFVIPVYADFPESRISKVLTDAPPIFVVCAQDDELGFSDHAIALYRAWIAAKRPAELHLFEKGGHGFGIGIEGTTTHQWLKMLAHWLQSNQLMDRPEKK